MLSLKKKIHVNIFTLLVIAAGLALVFRIVNIVTFKDMPSERVGAIMSAEAVEETDEKPPVMTKATTEEAHKKPDDAKPEVKKDAETEGPDSIKPPTAAAAPSVPPDTSSENRAFSPSEIEVLQSLSRRRDDLEKREQKVSAREALLSAAEQEVDRKIGELNKLRGEIEALLGKQQTMEDDRITSLVKIYEGMKPKEAATIFNTLDMNVLLSVISRMSERKSSPILASMDPDKARIVTIRLAEQRKLPETAGTDKKPAATAPPPAAR